MKVRAAVIAVAATLVSGCAGLVVEYLAGRAGDCLCFKPVFEAMDDGELLATLTAADIEADAADGVALRATVIGPAHRGFLGLTLAEAGTEQPDAAPGRGWVRMTVRGMGQVTHRYLEFTPAPADPTIVPRGTIVLLHSLNTDRMQLLPLALALGDQGWQSVLVDLRGHGDSGGARSWGAKDGGDVKAIIDAVDAHGLLTPPVFALGASYGAAAALRWAQTDPRAAGVAVVAGFAEPGDAIMRGAIVAKPRLARLVGERGFERGIARASDELGVDLADARPQLDAAAALGHRLLIVHGADDAVVPPDHAVRLHEAAAGSRFVLRDGVGHVDLVVRQELYITELLGWLESLRSRSE